jgi:hypothetical protein
MARGRVARGAGTGLALDEREHTARVRRDARRAATEGTTNARFRSRHCGDTRAVHEPADTTFQFARTKRTRKTSFEAATNRAAGF